MQPFISVLLPTRKRVAKVESSLATLLGKARNPDTIQICIAYDDDDPESHAYFAGDAWSNFLRAFGASTSVLKTQRHGYMNLQRYLNELVPLAQGKWMFFWGDDAFMQTQNWDDQVKVNEDYVGLWHITAENQPMRCSVLPLFHRAWVDMFGCVSPINPADSWISEICIEAKARRVIPVSVLHRVNPEESPDETFMDKKKAVGWQKDFWLPGNVALRSEWAKKIQDYRSAH